MDKQEVRGDRGASPSGVLELGRRGNGTGLASCYWIGPERAIQEFVVHYHHERNHQGLGNCLIVSDSVSETSGTILRRERLGGMLNYYYRAAA
jgi:hypothetical protein